MSLGSMPKLQEENIYQLLSDKPDAIRWMIGCGLLFMFCLPVVGWYWKGEGHLLMRQFLKVPYVHHVNKGLLIWLLTLPVILIIQQLTEAIPFGRWIPQNDHFYEEVISSLFKGSGIALLLKNVLLIAILPAICEELFFRGLLLGSLLHTKLNQHVSVLIVSVLFALMHLESSGFLSRVLLGLILGYLFVRSGSIWLSVIIHFIHNLVMVLGLYFNRNQLDMLDNIHFSIEPLHVISGIVCGVLIFFIFRSMQANRSEQQYQDYAS